MGAKLFTVCTSVISYNKVLPTTVAQFENEDLFLIFYGCLATKWCCRVIQILNLLGCMKDNLAALSGVELFELHIEA